MQDQVRVLDCDTCKRSQVRILDCAIHFFWFWGEEGGKILPYCSRGNRRLRMACARIDARSDSRVHQLLYTSFRSSTRSSSWAPCVYSEPRSTLSDLVKRSCCTFS